MKKIITLTLTFLFLFSNINVNALENRPIKESTNQIVRGSMLMMDEASLDGTIETGMTKIIKIIRTFYDIILVLVPIALIVLGTLDLLKAVGSQDEKAIKSAQSSLGRRLIWAAVALSSMLIFRLVLSFVAGGSEWRTYWN